MRDKTTKGCRLPSTFRGAMLMKAALLAGVGLGATADALADDATGAIENMLGKDSELTLQLRTYALDRHPPGQAAQEAWAAGGWLDYRSGWLADTLRFGVVGYTSQPVWAPDDTSGTLLLSPTQGGYSVLGQAYLSLKLYDQVLSGGRFEVSQPEVNPEDNRMTPNTFEGGNLGGVVGGVTYYVAYLNAMKTRNATSFDNFATVAGAPAGVSSPLWLIGLGAEPVKGLGLRLSSYHVPDILDSTYADAIWLTALNERYKLRLSGQAMYQNSTGSDALTGSAFWSWAGGVKADLIAGPATATLGYTQIGRGANYQSPYGGWAGYTFMIDQSFDKAGQRAVLIAGTYDFASVGAPGMLLNAAVTIGRDAIDPSTGAPQANQTEYDLTLDYRFSAARWPDWLRPLWLRGRAAIVEQSLSGTDSRITDYRIIVNYPWTLK